MIPLITGYLYFKWELVFGQNHGDCLTVSTFGKTQSLGSLLDLVRPKTFISSGNYHLYVDEFDKEKRELKNIYVVQQQTDKSGKIAKTMLSSPPRAPIKYPVKTQIAQCS